VPGLLCVELSDEIKLDSIRQDDSNGTRSLHAPALLAELIFASPYNSDGTLDSLRV
jgi:hypothetical protein